MKTLTFMRDEILASYGYRFPEQEKIEHFHYLGRITEPDFSLEEVESQLTDIDKHNHAFLNEMLERLKPVQAI